MPSLLVRPSEPLAGTVPISGAKNSVLKLMAATVLCPGTYRLSNVPRISDVEWMRDALAAIGGSSEWTGPDVLEVHSPEEPSPEAPYELVEKMRASTALLGPLLARCGEARIAMPGGDDFGSRPINLHLSGLEVLGATFELRHGTIDARAPHLRGGRVVLEYPSVGATESVLLASTLADGTTTIENAAREPEISDLAAFLNRMGARVLGAGSPQIVVEGVAELRPVDHEIVPDRIEATTFLACVAVAGGEVTLAGANGDHLSAVVRKFGDMGVRVAPDSSGLWVMSKGRLRSADIASLPYPGVATDVLPLFVAALAVAEGTSFATENLFGGRFRYVGELARMGASIDVEGHHLVIDGVEWLSGAPVRAFDIRAGAALVVAGLRAEGETVVHDAHHLDRGYDRFAEKLAAGGADVRRVDT
jgi:UDP-N-acetylglucosamine 1-carboxyvinyltransferase